MYSNVLKAFFLYQKTIEEAIDFISSLTSPFPAIQIPHYDLITFIKNSFGRTLQNSLRM